MHTRRSGWWKTLGLDLEQLQVYFLNNSPRASCQNREANLKKYTDIVSPHKWVFRNMQTPVFTPAEISSISMASAVTDGTGVPRSPCLAQGYKEVS